MNTCETKLSVVVPVFNSEDKISPMSAAMHEQLEKSGVKYEVIFIDDGSNDGTFNILKTLKKTNSRMRIIRFDRNYGQHSAISAGLNLSRGEQIFVVNDDMKHNLPDMSRFLKEIEGGFEIVFGWRHPRRDKPFLRKTVSSIFNLLISIIIKRRLHDPGAGFMCFKRSLLKPGDSHLQLIRNLKNFKFTELKIPSPETSPSRYGPLNLLKLFYVISLNIFIRKELNFKIAECLDC